MTMLRNAPWWMWGLALVLPAAHAAADAEAELEQLLSTPVYAASKYKQTLADAPASVTVLTQGDIRAFGWRTLGEVLNGVRGVFLRYDRGYTYAGVRGLSRPGDYTSRLLLLIDGVRANENIYDSVLVGREFPIDMSLIERVEFIPGPGSALYGSNAVLGVINVITRSAASLRGGSATLGLDNDGGRKLQLSLSREFTTGALVLAGSAENRRGRDLYLPEFDSPATDHGIVRGLDGERDRKLYARWTGGDWTFSALSSERSKRVPNAAYDLVFSDPSVIWTDRISLLGATWQHGAADGSGWYAHAGLGDYRYNDLGRYEPDRQLATYRNVGRWLHLELRRTLRLGASQQLVAGVDIQRNLTQAVGSRMLEPVAEAEAWVQTSGTRVGVYLNDEITLQPGLVLGLGARADRETDGHQRITPRLALLWKPVPTLVAKALAGSAYREPNVYERLPANGVAEFDTGLRHELVRSRELAVDWQAQPRTRLSASLFSNRITDMIEQVADADTGELVYRNVGSAKAQGLEAEVEFVAEAGWRVRASWSRQRVTLDDGAAASNAPRSLAKLHGTLPWTPLAGWPVRLGLELQRVGQRLTLAGAALPTHLLANATLQLDPAGRPWSLGLSVYNLGDLRYSDPAGPEHVGDVIAQDGRRAALRWTVAF